MKFSTTALTLLFSGLAAANGVNFFSVGGQKPLGDGEAVPGTNPLKYCSADHSSEVFDLDYVNLSPNPPVAGTNLTIEAAGTVLEDIEEGAYVILQVKYGLIRLINTQADFCEQIKTVDLDCPLKKGHQKIIKDVAIPKEVPPGTYTVFADVYTKEKKKVICLEAVVRFGAR